MARILPLFFILLFINSAIADELLRMSVNKAVTGLKTPLSPVVEVCEVQVCPKYLTEFIKEDSEGTSLPEKASPEEVCLHSDKAHFKSANDLENGFAAWSGTALSHNGPSLDASCLLNVKGKDQKISDRRRSLVVGEYYYDMNRFKLGTAEHLDEIVSIDSILGTPILKGVDCKQFTNFGAIKSSCNSFQTELKCKAQNSLTSLAKETLKALAVRRDLNKEIRTTTDPKKRPQIEAAVKAMGNQYPWMKGTVFMNKCSAWDKCSEAQVASAIKDQLIDDRSKHVGSLALIHDSVECMNDPKAESDHCENLDRNLKRMPEFDLDTFDKTPAQQDLRQEFARAMCHQEERDRKNGIKTIKKEIGITLGLSLLSFGTGSFVRMSMLAGRAKEASNLARGAAWSAIFAAKASYAIPALKDAKAECDSLLKYVSQNESSHDAGITCPKEMTYGKGNYVRDYGGCMMALSLVALDMTPAATSIAPLFVKEGRIVSGIAAIKNAPKAIVRLGPKLKKGIKRYIRQVKWTKGKRLFIKSRDTKAERGVLQKINDFTMNPIATIRNSRREVAIPVSMVGYSLLVETPQSLLENKVKEDGFVSAEDLKESLPGGEYAWELMLNGAISPDEIANIFNEHDAAIDGWLSNKNQKLPRLLALQKDLWLSPVETEDLNKLAWDVYNKELESYRASTATGTKEERSAFNQNIVSALEKALEGNTAFARFSSLERQLLSSVYYPVIPIVGTSSDDIALTSEMIRQKNPGTKKILELIGAEPPKNLSLGDALLMVSEAKLGPDTKKIAKAKQELPAELQAIAVRPEFPWIKNTEVVMSSAPGGKEIKLTDEIDRWKLLSSDARFSMAYDLYKKGEISEVEAMKFIQKVVPSFNQLYSLMKTNSLSHKEALEVMENPLMGSVAEALEKASTEKKWSPKVKVDKELEAVKVWLEFHRLLSLNKNPKPEEYDQRFNLLLSK
jgi:hypothetical protein